MANDVFANGREISCKAGSGKSIAAFPDVCMTPPENPATPPGTPVPYPNTGMASDTTSGSKKVKISNKEVMLKNKSYFKKSVGDEAGCAAKKGVVTSTNRGKVYFKAWSMDVKVEGKNVVRHLDITTHNHRSEPGQTPPFPHVDTSAFASSSNCSGDKEAMDEACETEEKCPGFLSKKVTEQRAAIGDLAGASSRTARAGQIATADAESNECVKKSRCYLRPYSANSQEDACCPGQTAHHIPPKACFKKGGKYQGSYSVSKALCVCMEGANQHTGSHGKNHAAIEYLAAQKGIEVGDSVDLESYNSLCAATVEAQSGCKKECIEDQLNSSLSDKDVEEVQHVTTNSSGELDAGLKQEIHASADLAKNSSGR